MGRDGEPWPTAPRGVVLASDAFCFARALHTPAGGGLRGLGEALCFGSPPGTGLCTLGKLEGRVENLLVRLLCPCSQPSIALLLTGWVSAAWVSPGDLLQMQNPGPLPRPAGAEASRAQALRRCAHARPPCPLGPSSSSACCPVTAMLWPLHYLLLSALLPARGSPPGHPYWSL